jgi:pimeloyl-ACP methyl ester carboxylesterase
VPRVGDRRGLAVLPLLAGLATASVAQPPVRATPPTPCAAIAATEPQAGHNMPYPGPVLFAADFPHLNDCEWGFPLGGWGGARRGAPRRHLPVVFVHGNQADAENWFLVADQFRQAAGYTNQEMYALSYNGLGNAYAGMPTQSTPAPESQAYWSANPNALCCSGGKGASDDPNVPDLYNFIRAVQDYTGSRQVEIVAHSLGVTITRKLLLLHPELRGDVVAAVMIAGGNHGTSVCRGIETTYYGCEEIAPGTKWLASLNAAGEAPGPTRWMSIYNGNDNADPFFDAVPGVFDDHQSPHLEGALNLQFAGTYHNDLRVSGPIVSQYLAFLLSSAHSSPGGIVAPRTVPPNVAGGALPNTSR